MTDRHPFGLDPLVDILKAIAEPTRFRLIVLLGSGDLTVTDLTEILGQSQPRISRHLKLLGEVDLIERYQEGAWAYFRLRQRGAAADVARLLIAEASATDPVLARDAARFAEVKDQRASQAQQYFSRNAAEWDEIRKLHVSEAEVERALAEIVGNEKVRAFLDLGTGTGRLLQLFAPIYAEGIGIDASRDMLSVARSNLERAGVRHAVVRHGDIFNLPFDGSRFDCVTIHQVLHFLDQPEAAIREAARMLAPGGRLFIVDFAPHGLDRLREEHAHRRLGFSHLQMSEWLHRAHLEIERTLDLEPAPESGGELTVTIWQARDRRAPAQSG